MLAFNTLKPSLSIFPKRSKGSRFTLEVWGSRLCSPDVAQPFATVCNRRREVAMAVPVASFATVVTFGGFRRRVASFRVAGVALCDIPTCFITEKDAVRSPFFHVSGNAVLLLHHVRSFMFIYL